MLKRLAPFARTNSNKSTPNPMKPNTIISTSAYHELIFPGPPNTTYPRLYLPLPARVVTV